jgi:hypothetical protein
MAVRLRGALCAAIALALLPAPAFAMHWAIYAPDEAGSRYWIDTDSIHKQDNYTYFTWVMTDQDATAPVTADGNQSAIDCATGDSLKLDNGNWVTGPHFGHEAYLYMFVCPH